MKRILLTTALVAFGTTPVFADTHSNSDTMTESQQQAGEGMQIQATDLIGKVVYVSSEETNSEMDRETVENVPDSWQNVADISDVLIDEDGNLAAIVVEAAWFDTDGETGKSISADDLQFVSDSKNESTFYVVYNGDMEQFEETDSYDAAAMEQDGYSSAADTDAALTINPKQLSQQDQDEGDQNTQSEDRSKMNSISLADLTTDDLDGIAIIGDNDERIGEISEMVLTEDGTISDVIVDVGGFLGVGEKPVAMKLSEIELLQAENGTIRGYVSMTETEVEELPKWSSKT